MSYRKKPFKFEMVGLSEGDKIIFDPLGIEVSISGPNTIEYDGKDWALSAFVKAFIPKKNAAGTYQGPKFFSFQGKTLVEIRDEMEKLREEEDW
jgi:hypothetical protein